MFRFIILFSLGLLSFFLGLFFLLKNNAQGDALRAKYTMEASKNFGKISSKIFTHEGHIWLLAGNNLLKIDASASSVESYEVPFSKLSGDFFLEESTVYAVSDGKKVFAYDFLKKEVLWEFDSPKSILANLIFKDNLIIFASKNLKIYALNKNNGLVDFDHSSDDIINDDLLVFDSKIYFADCSGFVTCLDIASKSINNTKISEHLPNSPIALDDSIFILDYENTLFCLDKNTLLEKWNLQSDIKKIFNLDDEIFVISDDLFVLNKEKAELEKVLSLGENLESIRKISSGLYCLSSKYSSFYIYNMPENEIEYKYNFGVDLIDVKCYLDKIFVLDADGNIYIIKENL